MFLRGKNKGEACKKNVFEDSPYYKSHFKIMQAREKIKEEIKEEIKE